MATQDVHVPDIGDFTAVEIIEVLVAEGDNIQLEDSIITVESDKASMEIPSPFNGMVKTLHVKKGDKVTQGDLILSLVMQADTDIETKTEVKAETKPASVSPTLPVIDTPSPPPQTIPSASAFRQAHATPSVRKFARELGADLSKITGTGRNGRITQQDVKSYIKSALQTDATKASSNQTGFALPPMPKVDFSQFGATETLPLTRINQLTGEFLQRNWLHIPHVTQFDQADITDTEAFRQQLNAEASAQSRPKISLLLFTIKAVVHALRAYPRFNSSLASDGKHLIQKHYYHIGIAVDTPDGLLVPVIRNADKKSLSDLAVELQSLSQKAREKKLTPSEMQGGCFSISSLGGIGGTHFTPIVNAPEVAILGLSSSSWQPVWDGTTFVPRLILPFALSYDHRVIDGADGARFTQYLGKLLTDIRRLLL